MVGLFLAITGCSSIDSRKPTTLGSANLSKPATVAAADTAGSRAEKPRDSQVRPAAHAEIPTLPPDPKRISASPADRPGTEAAARGPDESSPAEPDRPIDFSTALGMVSGQNPQVAFANERIAEAYAHLRSARVLWLPSIRGGISFDKHEGPLQANDGTIVSSSRWALEPGLGMLAVGGGAPAIPGVVANFRLADALFQPRIAGFSAAARENAATATTHDLLLLVPVAYLDLLRAFQQRAIAQDTLQHAQQLADLTATFARVGQGTQADADRAQAELAVRKNDLPRAEEAAKVASARLAELLSLEPAQVLAPKEPAIVPI